ncbi:plipastatin synthase subunit C [Clostridium puniceum]|uniref:Plipastatin synthase subunit C n=1 Tax=Clostridium puniceum TaxID=29367 RepID=A0A1S8TGN6_9CLOT|nr:non-ribosomal peptide synthetase [Clostridium puniceum]OOM76970.1 plipastatin synthase subunit C [Clostridium puniceum]
MQQIKNTKSFSILCAKYFEEKEFWIKEINEIIDEGSIFECFHMKSSKLSGQYETESFILDDDLRSKLRIMSKDLPKTTFIILNTMVSILLSMYSEKNRISFAIPSMRSLQDNKNEVIPIRVQIDNQKSFKDNLINIGKTFSKYINSSVLPLEELIKVSDSINSSSIKELYELLLFSNTIHERDSYDNFYGILNFESLISDNCIKIKVHYDNGVFYKFIIKDLIENFKHVIRTLLENSDRKICDISLMKERKMNAIINEFNNTDSPIDSSSLLHSFLEECVDKNPSKNAIYYENKVITYLEFENMSNKVANFLINNNVKKKEIVAVKMKKSPEMLSAMMGILKAGCSYLPIDINCPNERLQLIQQDSGFEKMIVFEKNNLSDYKIECLNITEMLGESDEYNKRPLVNISNDDIAYIIYTSGSTGTPKGVPIKHKSIVNRLIWMRDKYRLNEKDFFLQKTPVTFDVSLWELFLWTFCKSKLCIVSEGHEKYPEKLSKYFNKHNITVVHFVPAMLDMFLQFYEDEKDIEFKSLKFVFVSGEKLAINLCERFYKSELFYNHVKLVNLYGPTEAAVDVTYFNVERDRVYDYIPIGKPIDNTKVYIMNKQLKIQPIGIIGDLYLSGVCLTPGYINNEALNNEKFIENPYINGEIMYKTGDTCSLGSDGNIVYHGRSDSQIKLRGYRIELGEIERRIEELFNVKSIVLPLTNPSTGIVDLCAYYSGMKKLSLKDMKEELKKFLPDYMIPEYVVKIDNMPLTTSGKINTRALLAPFREIIKNSNFNTENNIINKVRTAWAEVLGINENTIKMDDNFFEIGGHSLKASVIILKLRKIFNVVLSIEDIFGYSTLGEFCDYLIPKINSSQDIEGYEIKRVDKKDYYALTPSQQRLYFIQQIDERGTGYNMSGFFEIKGEFDYKKIETSFIKIIRRHEVLRTGFRMINDVPKQFIIDDFEFKVEIMQATEENVQVKSREFIKPFELERPPLIRVALIKLSTNHYVMGIDMHHIISDGSSLGIIVNEFMSIYNEEKLPKLEIQYKDFVEWHNEYIKLDKYKEQGKYWSEYLSTEIPDSSFPLDYERKSKVTFNGDLIEGRIENLIKQNIDQYCMKNNVTNFMLYLAVYNILISKFINKDEVIVGIPIAGRNNPDIQNLIGMFINMIPIKNRVCEKLRFEEYLQEIKKNVLQAFKNKDYSFDDMVKSLQVERDNSRNPIFDNALAVQNMEIGDICIDGLQITPFDSGYREAKFDTYFEIYDKQDCINLKLEYSTDIFKRSSMQLVIDNFISIIRQVIEETEININQIDINLIYEKAEIVELEGEFDF